MADEMDVDVAQPEQTKAASKSKKEGKDSGKARFEVKKVRVSRLDISSTNPFRFHLANARIRIVERSIALGVG